MHLCIEWASKLYGELLSKTSQTLFWLCAPRVLFWPSATLELTLIAARHWHKSTEVPMWHSICLYCIFCPVGACGAAPTQHSRCCHGNLQAGKERGITDLDFSELNILLPIEPDNSKHTCLETLLWGCWLEHVPPFASTRGCN